MPACSRQCFPLGLWARSSTSAALCTRPGQARPAGHGKFASSSSSPPTTTAAGLPPQQQDSHHHSSRSPTTTAADAASLWSQCREADATITAHAVRSAEQPKLQWQPQSNQVQTTSHTVLSIHIRAKKHCHTEPAVVPRSLIGSLMPKRSSQTHIGRVCGGVMCIAGSVQWICNVAQQGALGGLTGVGFRQGLYTGVWGEPVPCNMKWRGRRTDHSGQAGRHQSLFQSPNWQLACSACLLGHQTKPALHSLRRRSPLRHRASSRF